MQKLKHLKEWGKLHNYGSASSPCTGVAAKGDDTVVTVGEDGRINVVNVSQTKPVRVIGETIFGDEMFMHQTTYFTTSCHSLFLYVDIVAWRTILCNVVTSLFSRSDKADSCTMNAVTFFKQFEVATVNSTGQLKVWDLREENQQPARTFLMYVGMRSSCLQKLLLATRTLTSWFFRSGDCIGLQCVDNHPTQPHIVATGGHDGTLCVWDMRQDRFPVTLLDAHSAHSE